MTLICSETHLDALPKARMTADGHPRVTLESDVFSRGDASLWAQAVLWCRDAQEAEDIARAINAATERAAREAGVQGEAEAA